MERQAEKLAALFVYIQESINNNGKIFVGHVKNRIFA